MPRILIADDHSVVRRRVREMLESEGGWEVCAEAATGWEAVAMAAAARPDVVVLDLSMPGLDGLQAARHIHEQLPQTAIVLLTMFDTSEVGDVAATVGVRTCISKTDIHRLLEVIIDI